MCAQAVSLETCSLSDNDRNVFMTLPDVFARQMSYIPRVDLIL